MPQGSSLGETGCLILYSTDVGSRKSWRLAECGFLGGDGESGRGEALYYLIYADIYFLTTVGTLLCACCA